MSFTTFITVLLTFLFIYYNTADSEILWLYGSIRSSPSSVYHRRGREMEHPVISECSVHQRPVKKSHVIVMNTEREILTILTGCTPDIMPIEFYNR